MDQAILGLPAVQLSWAGGREEREAVGLRCAQHHADDLAQSDLRAPGGTRGNGFWRDLRSTRPLFIWFWKAPFDQA